ncbi:MAG: 8-oxoguanine DNA glycosylase [Clostridia bacterium]|nr:8-oxoguanine DNA glycosylase [Clostridia bacterium]
MNNNDIIVSDLRDFDIRQILDCGQIFRYVRNDDGSYTVYSTDKRCNVRQSDGYAVIGSDDKSYFTDFFDLSRDYSLIKSRLESKPFMAEAISYGSGIRILNSQPWEMIISFIISANNHIPRIKGIIDRLCTGLGKNMGDYYAFPSPEAMASKDEDYYASIGAGYRAAYLAKTARAVADGDFNINAVYGMDSASAGRYLCTLMGVGPKVADCILLFGYHREDVFPVDTWIKKVYRDTLGGIDNNAVIRKRLIEIYGDLSGYAQQYLFFNKRDTN